MFVEHDSYSLSMEFQAFEIGLPFPPPGDPDPGMKPGSSALQADSLPGKSRTVKPRSKICGCLWSHFEP